jgi:hypothetical protein
MDLISKDKQVIFNTAIRQLAKQGFKSADKVSCHYSLDGGKTRCAIGWCMTEEALENFNGGGTVAEIVEEGFNLGRYSKEFLRFLGELQHVHDKANTREDFRNQVLAFAERYKLNDNRARRYLSLKWVAQNKGRWDLHDA